MTFCTNSSIEVPVDPAIIPTNQNVINSMKITGVTEGVNIGIATFAKHLLESWPKEYMNSLIKTFCEKHKAHAGLFGGPDESEKLRSFQQQIPGTISLAGRLKLEEELAFMTRLDFMISMDSSNMHMASLVGTRDISIWGGTDPLTGFGAWGQPEEFFVRIPVEELSCRPCTIYGKGKCRKDDHACMIWLNPEMIYDKLKEIKCL